MDKLLAMQVFAAVAECGSQSAAADRLALSRPAVSRYLAELEQWCGARLLHRTTRRLSLTPSGSALLPRCHQLLDLADEMRDIVTSPEEDPHGRLRIACSTSFGHAQLAPAAAAFSRRYPRVHIDMVLSDRAVNLVDERIDLGLRIAGELDPNLIARRLADCASVVCAAPAYLLEHGVPASLEDLARRNCLTHSYHGRTAWNFQRAGEPVGVEVSGSISADEATALMQAALAGAGIAMLPLYLAAPVLHAGRLVQLFADCKAQGLGLYAVYTSRKHAPVSLRKMVEFLSDRFSRADWETS
jgi:DNA-binding transcriptional LysR family regulator